MVLDTMWTFTGYIQDFVSHFVSYLTVGQKDPLVGNNL